MRILKTISECSDVLNAFRHSGKQIGFVPTMGALHKGHLSLMETARKGNDIVVCSIFVNPIQFNKKEDLSSYPRDMEGDVKKLEAAGIDILFAPSADEMYPEEVKEIHDLQGMDRVMEGEFRPGHFNGVVVVVKKLFEIVHPHKAYFGQKDYQQLMIIKYMSKKYSPDVDVIGCPTVREDDGLAMSSRNLRLKEKSRRQAPFIYQSLLKAKGLVSSKNPDEIREIIAEGFKKHPDFKLEYFEIADSNNLKPVKRWESGRETHFFIAAWIGGIRLIDNIAIIL